MEKRVLFIFKRQCLRQVLRLFFQGSICRFGGCDPIVQFGKYILYGLYGFFRVGQQTIDFLSAALFFFQLIQLGLQCGEFFVPIIVEPVCFGIERRIVGCKI